MYAVDRGGVLHALANETVAAGLYGTAWGSKIDDVAEVLYGNFLFGTDIAATSAFSPSTATSNTTSIDGNF